ncbi:MAG: HAMP domain-containing protein [Ignavibacteriales bacterium]|nr:HAMP domain-containing protein [Ignavibacteriales bacterium]MBK7978797.1 HAMP domain-containing protein [Ignavibacteriota bacterium]
MLSLKTKIYGSFSIIIFTIIALVLCGIYSLNELAQDSRAIIKDNYHSIDYSFLMIEELDKFEEISLSKDIHNYSEKLTKKDSLLKVLSNFSETLLLQKNNVTEKGELELVNQLEVFFKNCRNKIIRDSNSNRNAETSIGSEIHSMRKIVGDIYKLNMNSIIHKNAIAKNTSEKVITLMSIISFGSLLIILFFLVKFPNYIIKPIVELTSKIKAISVKSFDQKINFKSADEIGSLTNAFNVMTERLKEFEEQHIDQKIFDKKRIESLVYGLNDGIILLDEYNNIVLINSKAIKLFSLEQIQTQNKNIYELRKHSDKLDKYWEKIFNENNKNGQIEIYDVDSEQYFNVDNIEIKLEKALNNKSEIKGKVLIFKNVTLFKEKDLAKTNLIATVSHELKTPISSINLSLKLLNDIRLGALNDEQIKLVEAISLQNRKLLRVVNELLDFAQVETGRINLIIEQTDPIQLIDLAISALLVLFSEKEIELDFELMENPPLIKADKEKSVWILVNLLTNAIRYSSLKGRIKIKLEKIENYLMYSVIDNGSGISQDELENIFKKFVRSDNKKGTGLGLSIAKEMVETQGGKIWVESKFHEGSQFHFTLPIA